MTHKELDRETNRGRHDTQEGRKRSGLSQKNAQVQNKWKNDQEGNWLMQVQVQSGC